MPLYSFKEIIYKLLTIKIRIYFSYAYILYISPITLVWYQTIRECLSLFNWADNGSLIQHFPPLLPTDFITDHSDHCPVVTKYNDGTNILFLSSKKITIFFLLKFPFFLSTFHLTFSKWKCWECVKEVLTVL